MSNLPELGTLSYNGWTFFGPRVSTSVEIRPIRDKSERTVIYNQITLSVVAYVTDDVLGKDGNTLSTSGNAAPNISWIRSALSKDGGALVFNDFGHGITDGAGGDTLEVNTNATNRDVNFGPKTRFLSIRPVAASAVFEVRWTVEIALPECGGYLPTAVGTLGNLAALNWGVEYSIDHAGSTVRTLSGYIQILLNRTTVGNVLIPVTADEYRDRFATEIPAGFRRDRQLYRLSSDKSSLHFTITDLEIPSDTPFPNGVVDIQMSHTVSSPGPGLHMLENTISGHAELAKGATKGTVWTVILLMIKSRVNHARAVIKAPDSLIITNFSITEEIFARKFSFSVSYRFATTGPSKIIAHSGLFNLFGAITSVDGWSDSLRNTAWHQRGVAGLGVNAVEDKILDPCNQTGPALIPFIPDTFDGVGEADGLTNTTPPREGSYFGWRAKVRVVDTRDVVKHKRMPMSPTSPQSYAGRSNSDGAYFVAQLPPDGEKSYLQDVSREGTVQLVFTGSAVRVGYTVELPDIIGTLNSTENITLLDSDIENEVLADYGGVIAYGARWEIRYEVNTDYQTLLNTVGTLNQMLLSTSEDPSGNKLLADNS